MVHYVLASLCKRSPRKINEIVNGTRGVSLEFALVLERMLGTTAEMWVRMKVEYDPWAARQKAAQRAGISLKRASRNAAEVG